MHNPKFLIGLGLIGLGILVIAVGIYLLVAVRYIASHPSRAYIVLGVGIVLIIAGIAILFMSKRSKAVSNRN